MEYSYGAHIRKTLDEMCGEKLEEDFKKAIVEAVEKDVEEFIKENPGKRRNLPPLEKFIRTYLSGFA